MSGVKGDPCGNRKAQAPRPAYRGAKTAPRAVFRAREIPRGREVDVAGVVGGGTGCRSWYSSLRKRAGRACPAPTGSLKIYGRQWYRNPSGAAAPPPFDKGGRERRGQDPSLRMEDSMAADAKRAGRACPAPTGSLKKAGMGANIAVMLLN